MFPAPCVINCSLWRQLSLRSFSRNEQVVSSSWEKKSLLANMKVILPLSALTFFLLLAYLTHPGKRDGKSFLVFHSIQVFFFSLLSNIFTLHSNKKRFFAVWILVFLNKSFSFYSLNGKQKFTTKVGWLFGKHKHLWLTWKSLRENIARERSSVFPLWSARLNGYI